MECGPSQYWYLSEARGEIKNGRFDCTIPRVNISFIQTYLPALSILQYGGPVNIRMVFFTEAFCVKVNLQLVPRSGKYIGVLLFSFFTFQWKAGKC